MEWYKLKEIDWKPAISLLKNFALILFSITVVPIIGAAVFKNIIVAYVCGALFYIIVSYRKEIYKIIKNGKSEITNP